MEYDFHSMLHSLQTVSAAEPTEQRVSLPMVCVTWHLYTGKVSLRKERGGPTHHSRLPTTPLHPTGSSVGSASLGGHRNPTARATHRQITTLLLRPGWSVFQMSPKDHTFLFFTMLCLNFGQIFCFHKLLEQMKSESTTKPTMYLLKLRFRFCSWLTWNLFWISETAF